MASLLYRLGRMAFRRRRIVLAAWLAALAAVVGCLLTYGGKLDNEFTIPGSESQKALDTMADTFPAASGTSAQIVFVAPKGQKITDGPNAAAVRDTMKRAAHAPQVAAVVGPFRAKAVSPDRTTALGQVQYPVDDSQLHSGTLDALEKTVQSAKAMGLRVEVGGPAYTNAKESESHTQELIGLGMALVVLTVTFGSLLAAGMPLLTALVGVAFGLLGLLAVSNLVPISDTAITLALMLGLAVGIDYALFILSRHRAQLAGGMAAEESAAMATGTAGTAVVFAGLTVVIALAGLSVVGIPFLTVMGLAASAAVLVGVLVAITLLPALLGFAGGRLRPRRKRRKESAVAEEPQAPVAVAGERWARAVTRAPLLTVLAVVAALLVLAVPARDLRLSLPDNGTAAADTGQRKAYDIVDSAFGPGFNGPLLVLADLYKADHRQQAVGALAKKMAALPNVAVVAQPQINRESGNAIIMVIPKTGPREEATADLVQDIRNRAPAWEKRIHGPISVTGTTAVSIDTSDRLADSLLPFALTVVGLAILLMLLAFRSIVVPIKASIGFLLSVAASFGAVVAVFQWGWLADFLEVEKTGPVVSFLPIILMAVLFGLAMDYEVFLVSRMREAYVHGAGPREAVLTGAKHATRVVTAAALIMFMVFAGFVPGGDAVIKPIAFSLAVGVLIDAFVVRMTFVPAFLVLTGKAAWWMPRWLDRLLPDLDSEGSQLRPPTGRPRWAKVEELPLQMEQAGEADHADESGVDGEIRQVNGSKEAETAGTAASGRS